MAKPRKRGVPRVPSVADLRKKSTGAGQAHASSVIGGKQPKPKPTDWTKYQRPEGFRRDNAGTWRLEKGVEAIGEGTGREGEYGFMRLEGRQAAEARAQAKKTYGNQTRKAWEIYEETGDLSQLLYFQTRTDHPDRPRTVLAGYDGRSKTVRILFRNGEHGGTSDLQGAIYEYYGVPYNVWRMVKRNASTGRTINRVLNAYPYAEIRSASR